MSVAARSFVGVALALPLALFMAPSAQESPDKGDMVYVAATFANIESAPVKGYVMNYTLTPCWRLEIVDANPKKARWVTNAIGYGSTIRLEGAWLPRIAQDGEACESTVFNGR